MEQFCTMIGATVIGCLACVVLLVLGAAFVRFAKWAFGVKP